MRAGARQAAAIEILESLEQQRRPAADVLKAWMQSHRFAGSKDRAEIGDLVFGAALVATSAWRFSEIIRALAGRRAGLDERRSDRAELL